MIYLKGKWYSRGDGKANYGRESTISYNQLDQMKDVYLL